MIRRQLVAQVPQILEYGKSESIKYGKQWYYSLCKCKTCTQRWGDAYLLIAHCSLPIAHLRLKQIIASEHLRPLLGKGLFVSPSFNYTYDFYFNLSNISKMWIELCNVPQDEDISALEPKCLGCLEMYYRTVLDPVLKYLRLGSEMSRNWSYVTSYDLDQYSVYCIQ